MFFIPAAPQLYWIWFVLYLVTYRFGHIRWPNFSFFRDGRIKTECEGAFNISEYSGGLKDYKTGYSIDPKYEANPCGFLAKNFPFGKLSLQILDLHLSIWSDSIHWKMLEKTWKKPNFV